MNDSGGWGRTGLDFAYVPDLPAAALTGVRTRRIFAILIDIVLITLIVMVLALVLFLLGLPTFGLTWLLIPPLYPATAFLYNGLSISGWRHGTPGMQMMDLEVRLTDGSPVPFINAAAHAVLFYLSWVLTPFILAISLFAAGKRCLHDMLAGVIVVRRPH